MASLKFDEIELEVEQVTPKKDAQKKLATPIAEQKVDQVTPQKDAPTKRKRMEQPEDGKKRIICLGSLPSSVDDSAEAPVAPAAETSCDVSDGSDDFFYDNIFDDSYYSAEDVGGFAQVPDDCDSE